MTGPLYQLEQQLMWVGRQCCCPDSDRKNIFRTVRAMMDEQDEEHAPLISENEVLLSPPEVFELHPTQTTHVSQPNLCIVMRHGHRQDELDEDWTLTAQRPWDPPLSKLGRQQARETGQELAALQGSQHISFVISSPYQRCLQTSAEVVAQLNLPRGRWLVDWSMGEMCEPRLLMPGRPDVQAQVEGRPIDSWMWDGSSIEQALDAFFKTEQQEACSCVLHPPASLHRPVPMFPETRDMACGRYQEEIAWLATGGVGQLPGNILVVTHGEAVRVSVNMMLPDATVYEVKHCSRSIMKRDQKDRALTGMNYQNKGLLPVTDLKEAGWKLACTAGQTGIQWFE